MVKSGLHQVKMSMITFYAVIKGMKVTVHEQYDLVIFQCKGATKVIEQIKSCLMNKHPYLAVIDGDALIPQINPGRMERCIGRGKFYLTVYAL